MSSRHRAAFSSSFPFVPLPPFFPLFLFILSFLIHSFFPPFINFISSIFPSLPSFRPFLLSLFLHSFRSSSLLHFHSFISAFSFLDSSRPIIFVFFLPFFSIILCLIRSLHSLISFLFWLFISYFPSFSLDCFLFSFSFFLSFILLLILFRFEREQRET